MQPGLTSNPFAGRQERLRSLLEARGLRLVVVTNPANIFYLTGFRGSTGVAIFGPSEALLWVDPRYTLEAQEDARGVEVREERRGLLKAVGRWLRRKRASRVGYEDSHLTCADFRELEVGGGGPLRFVPMQGAIEELRLVKDQEEIGYIRRAGHLTAAVFEEVLPEVRPGLRESDLAAEIEYRMRRKGAAGAAFDTIVASGHRSALPHARASSKLLGKSELVIFDLGAILSGYVADMTRTLYLGQPCQRVRGLYNAVQEAQQQAVEALREGIPAGDVDAVARGVLARRGLEKYFTHSTGHGVGLEIHEKPRLGRGEKTRLKIGFVVTAEPGIYLEGFGGVRVEDTVVLGEEGPEILTPASKDRWFIS